MPGRKYDLEHVGIDIDHMCIDRSTPEGQMFDKLNAIASKKAGTPEGDFMARMLGFTEAAMVINNTMSGKEAENALAELRKIMEDPTAGQ